jgi:predicted nucleic acid-binding Zn ribbon protein
MGVLLMYYCGKCKTKLPHGAEFCPNCKTKIIYPNDKAHDKKMMIVTIVIISLLVIGFLINHFSNNNNYNPANMSKKEFNQYMNDLDDRQHERIDNQKAFPGK